MPIHQENPGLCWWNHWDSTAIIHTWEFPKVYVGVNYITNWERLCCIILLPGTRLPFPLRFSECLWLTLSEARHIRWPPKVNSPKTCCCLCVHDTYRTWGIYLLSNSSVVWSNVRRSYCLLCRLFSACTLVFYALAWWTAAVRWGVGCAAFRTPSLWWGIHTIFYTYTIYLLYSILYFLYFFLYYVFH